MASSLGLTGDLDDVELIEDIEAAFNCRFADQEIENCWTVGDLFQLVESKLPDDDKSLSCSTAMCFYRLRRALQSHSQEALRPSSPIAVLSSMSVRKLYRTIEVDCGLRPPAPVISLFGCVALFMVFAPFGAMALQLPWWIALPTSLLGAACYWIAPIRLPESIRTFGDLVRAVNSRSIGTLSDQGARLSKKNAWSAFLDILGEHSSLPKDQIAEETYLIIPKPVSA